jgi:hypothetical protein
MLRYAGKFQTRRPGHGPEERPPSTPG